MYVKAFFRDKTAWKKQPFRRTRFQCESAYKKDVPFVFSVIFFYTCISNQTSLICIHPDNLKQSVLEHFDAKTHPTTPHKAPTKILLFVNENDYTQSCKLRFFQMYIRPIRRYSRFPICLVNMEHKRLYEPKI